MQAFLTDLYANASGPLVSAFLLGLLIAVAPCPMTLNITAMGFIGRNISDRRRIFFNGVFYALGTMVSYTFLALIMYLGANQFRISAFFQQNSEKIVGPLLLLIGVYMIGLSHLNFPAFAKYRKRFERRTIFRSSDSFPSFARFGSPPPRTMRRRPRHLAWTWRVTSIRSRASPRHFAICGPRSCCPWRNIPHVLSP